MLSEVRQPVRRTANFLSLGENTPYRCEAVTAARGLCRKLRNLALCELHVRVFCDDFLGCFLGSTSRVAKQLSKLRRLSQILSRSAVEQQLRLDLSLLQRLAKLLKLPAAKDAGFTDNTADAWDYDAINRCAAAGILNGNGDGTVTP